MGRMSYILRHRVWCNKDDWLVRQKALKALQDAGYVVEECPNPGRLNIQVDGKLFIIDIWDGDVHISENEAVAGLLKAASLSGWTFDTNGEGTRW